MLANMCKNCGQFVIAGRVNEFNEHFCDERCYLEYCYIHHYEPHLERLKIEKINNMLH